MPGTRLIAAAATAARVRDFLAARDSVNAVAILTNAVADLIESQGVDVPRDVFGVPGPTGDTRYDAVLTTAYLYAANLCGIEPPTWTQIEPLDSTYLWGSERSESTAYIEFVRQETPAVFLQRNILCRPRDWVN